MQSGKLKIIQRTLRGFSFPYSPLSLREKEYKERKNEQGIHQTKKIFFLLKNSIKFE